MNQNQPVQIIQKRIGQSGDGWPAVGATRLLDGTGIRCIISRMTGTTTPCGRCGTPLPADAKFCHRCGAPRHEDPRSGTDRLREALGPDYAVTGELGSGGFAVVYLVEDLKKRRHLALKVLRRELLFSEVLVARFRREIELASRLSHPNILPVIFAGEAQGLAY